MYVSIILVYFSKPLRGEVCDVNEAWAGSRAPLPETDQISVCQYGGAAIDEPPVVPQYFLKNIS